jgi:hypothetical protein
MHHLVQHDKRLRVILSVSEESPNRGTVKKALGFILLNTLNTHTLPARVLVCIGLFSSENALRAQGTPYLARFLQYIRGA